MAKKKVIKRKVTVKKQKGLLDKHPHLIWLIPLLVVVVWIWSAAVNK